jgi:PKD repeat protein
MAIKTITVSTAAQLKTALSQATGGETILLNPGNYDKLTLTERSGFDITYNSEVTIRSADPARPAVFAGLDIRGAENLSFRDLVFDYVAKATDQTTITPFSITGSTNITISGSVFDGDLAKGGDAAAIGYPTGRGLNASGNTNFAFLDNEMHSFWKGLAIGGNTNARVIGNDFHSMRSDGLNANAVSGLLIENNYFHDFKRAWDTGDHADFIQFSSTDAKRPSSDVTIRGNLFDSGNNGDGIHTIFMRNDQVDKGLAGTEMFFRNILIEQNTIYADHLHGISVGETAGLVIRNNTLLHAREDGLNGAISAPRIGVATDSTDVTIIDNIASKVAGGLEGYSALPPGWTVGNNLIVQNTNMTEPNHYSELFVSTTTDGGGSGGRAFFALPGGLIETMGVGSDRILIDRAPEKATPLFHVGTPPEDDTAYVFDAAHFSFGPQGALAADGARFLWSFGDGTTAEGGVVTHRYAAPGSYAVKLEVVQSDGSKVAVTETVHQLKPDLLRFDAKTGDFAVSDGITETMIDINAAALAGRTGTRTLDLDAATKASVGPKAIEGLFGADNFTLSLRLKADVTPDSSGNVLRLQNTLSGGVNRDGNFSFTLNTDDGQKTTVVSQGVSLLDGRAHDVRILFDADHGLLSIAVDGRPPVSAAISGNLPPMGSWGLTFGNPPTGQSFDGKLLALDLDVVRSPYPVHDADAMTLAARAMAAAIPEVPTVTLDDYVLDGAAMAGLTATAFRADAHLAQEDGQTVLSFDGVGDRVTLGKLTQFEAADRLAVSVDFQRDVADGSAGTLVANAGQVRLDLQGDGFSLRVATADAGMKTYTLGALGLNGTDRHEAVVIVDAVADRLQVFLDSRLVFEDTATDLVMTNPEGGSAGWVLGQGFDGWIADFRVDDDIGHQVATGDVVLFA